MRTNIEAVPAGPSFTKSSMAAKRFYLLQTKPIAKWRDEHKTMQRHRATSASLYPHFFSSERVIAP